MNRLKNKKLLTKITALVFFCLIISSFAVVGIFSANVRKAHKVDSITQEKLETLELENVHKLMIVAHPDDETIWGGAHLADGDYLVVCITNGRNKKRKKEYAAVMEVYGCKYIMLEYPDLVNKRKDKWDKVSDNIMADLDVIIGYRDWDLIVTHNIDGEYGHIHHKLTNAYVTDICVRKELISKLYYFGEYYTKKDIGDAENLIAIGDDEKAVKLQAVNLYKSQKKTMKKLSHMFDYEMWQQAQ